MERKALLLLLFFFMAACGATPQAVATPSKEIVPTSLPTSTTIPPSTSIPATPNAAIWAISLKPTTDPNFFRDEFEGALDAQWSWVREDPLNWSLVTIPGSLQINVEAGYVPAHNNSNLLLRPAPQDDFQIETKLTFLPTHNFQFAGLIIYQSDSNFIQAGRQFCSAVDCIGDGLYMDSYQKGLVVNPSVGRSISKVDAIWLRLSRRGNSYTFEATTNNSVWFNIGSQTSDISPLQVGLVVGQTLKGRVLPAVFDYFEVRSLS